MTTKEFIHRIQNRPAFMDQIARLDFAFFVRRVFPLVNGGGEVAWNWHLDAITCRLQHVQKSQVSRLLVTMPPRNLKSFMISVAWPAWMLGQDPTLNFVCVSYSGELAGKLARDCQAVMQSSLYRRLFPRTIISTKRSAQHDFETTTGGGRLATSITGTLTGRGGNIIIIDDPIKPDEAESETTRGNVNDWFKSTLASRLNDKRTGAIICVMQRLHQYDLAGAILEDGGWDHLSLSAIATEDSTIPLTRGRLHHRRIDDVLHPERESRAILERIKAEQGSTIFNAQYQQDPVPAGGNFIQRDWLKFADPATGIPEHGFIIQSWDTASKEGVQNDYSVCVTARQVGNQLFVLDVFRERLAFPELKKNAIRLANHWQAHTVLIEDAASGQQLLQSLRAEQSFIPSAVIGISPEGDKKTRLAGVSSMIEAGNVFLPTKAPWLADFESELLGFPHAKYDDQVDALSQLLAWVRKRSQYDDSPIGAPIIFTASDYPPPSSWHSDDRWLNAII